MVQPLALLAPFNPVNPVTPFTFRDTATNLTILHGLVDKVNAIIEQVNLSLAEDQDNLESAINDLTNSLNLTLMNYQVEITNLVESTHDEGVAFNPTTGTRVDPVSKVIGDTYDNTRVFAYFALQYDNLGLTAAAYDALTYSARHFDLGVTYPTLNDVQETV